MEELTPIIIIPLNNTLNFTCMHDAVPTATVEWLFNNTPVDVGNPRISITDVGGLFSLTVANINHNDSGEYTCRASNNIGSDNSTTMLLISSKYRFEKSAISLIQVHSNAMGSFCNTWPLLGLIH